MSREVMQMALDALEELNMKRSGLESLNHEIDALKAALAQPDVPETAFGETEPVAWGVGNTRPTEKGQFIMLLHSLYAYKDLLVPLYAAPPRREWVGLTDEEFTEIRLAQVQDNIRISEMLQRVEAKLKEKNT